MEKLLYKKGYYSIYQVVKKGQTTFKVDSGKTLFVKRFNKVIPNPYRDIKEFENIKDAEFYVGLKMVEGNQEKKKKLKELPKSLYLVLIKEEKSNRTFVKVGITSKKFIIRRFSKIYGYEGYTVESILRRIDSPKSEEIEAAIKDTLKKKRSVKNYRPKLKTFGGYSECYDFKCFKQITEVFDLKTKNL
jgi:hypothetical protein